MTQMGKWLARVGLAAGLALSGLVPALAGMNDSVYIVQTCGAKQFFNAAQLGQPAGFVTVDYFGLLCTPAGGGGGGGGGVVTGGTANGAAPSGTNAQPVLVGGRDGAGNVQTATPSTPLSTQLYGTLPAFAATPTVKIDQTTFASTNAVAPLGQYVTSAPTLTNGQTYPAQVTANGSLYADLTRSQGATNFATVPTGAVPGVNASVMGQYNTTLPTPAAGGSVPLQTDANGRLIAYIYATQFPLSVLPTVYNASLQTYTSGGANVLQADLRGHIKTSEAGSSDPLVGIAPAIAGSAANGVVIKASAGNLYGAYATCTAACWLMIFNSTTIPADGATTAGTASGNLQDCVPIAAGAQGGVNYRPGPGEVFTVGISAAISSTACATKTAATTGFVHGDAR